MLTKIKGLLNKTNKGTYLALLFMIVFIFSGDVAFAADEKMDFSANIVIAIVAVIVGFFSELIGLLIGSGFTSGSLFGTEFTDTLKNLWVLVSNIVYFIFAFLLVWIAFMNIVGKEGAEYELKQALPKFIVGVLIVPFSWFAVNFIISISAILTVSVLGLATDTIKGTSENVYKGVTICKDMKIDAASIKSLNKEGGITGDKLNGLFSCDGSPVDLTTILNTSKGVGGIMAIYTYGIMKIQTTDTLYSKNIADGINGIADIIIKFGVDIIFLIIYGLLLIAITISLFIRGVYIWLFMMFSPIFGLLYFFGDKGGESLKKFNFKEFINLALVPVYVAAALSFGLMFVFVTANSMQSSDTKIMYELGLGKVGEEGVHTTSINGTFMGVGDSEGDSSKLFSFLKGVTGKIFLNVISLIVLWMAVMAALKSSEITGAAIQPIADFGKSMGDLMQNAPKYVPILPGGTSMSGLSTAGGDIKASVEQKARTSGDKLSAGTKSMFGLSDDDVSKMMKDTNGIGSSIKNNLSARGKDINSIMSKVDFESAKTDSRMQEAIQNRLKTVHGFEGKIDFSTAQKAAKSIWSDNNVQKSLRAGGIMSESQLLQSIHESVGNTWDKPGTSSVKEGEKQTKSKETTDAILASSNDKKVIPVSVSDDTHLVVTVDDKNKSSIDFVNKSPTDASGNYTSEVQSFKLDDVENIKDKKFSELNDSTKKELFKISGLLGPKASELIIKGLGITDSNFKTEFDKYIIDSNK